MLVVLSVSVLTRTTKLRIWLCPLKYDTNPCAHLWCLTTADTKSFIPDNTNNTTDSLGQYIYLNAYSQINKQTKTQWSLWMIIFDMIQEYIAMSNVTLQTWTHVTQAAV